MMAPKLKPVRQQIVVILGASSGIGRATAVMLARRGAKVVVAARSKPGLDSLVEEINTAGGSAIGVVCDVSDFAAVQRVAAQAVNTFGRIDTWVNAAAVSVYARFEDTSPAEFKRLMEVNYLGQVHGALAALPHLRASGRGALIAISSVESIVSLPLHSSYAATKHAVEGVMDAFRRELMAEKAPISVTSIKPATINTPFFNNALNKMTVKPQGPPPFYRPQLVAECVVYAAAHPVRDLFVGGAGRSMVLGQKFMPRRTDATLARVGIRSAQTREPAPLGAQGAVWAPRTQDSRIDGDFASRARRVSSYTWFQRHPRLRAARVAGVLVAAPLTAWSLARRRAF
jgi:NAD(P)-dependent dehydrogenase (short-subunit alcohol dehydrogenase family)